MPIHLCEFSMLCNDFFFRAQPDVNKIYCIDDTFIPIEFLHLAWQQFFMKLYTKTTNYVEENKIVEIAFAKRGQNKPSSGFIKLGSNENQFFVKIR